MRAFSISASTALTLLALASAVVLVLGAASMLPNPVAYSGSLWFVLAVGLLLGPLGLASFGRRDS